MIEIGKVINNRYKILASIGSGGMANVFLAHDLFLNRDVAIKVLRFDFQNDQTAIRRFQREALAATELVHPNIVSVYDVGEEDQMQYLVMEYVKGMDLKRYIQTHYPIPYDKVIDIMAQVVSAVSLAHEHGIIHRDLKPQNILMDEGGIVKIADFGIAIALSETSITQTNSLLGSVHYLSPEQARGSMATRQTDIYALGIILYEMLAGQVPFDGESAVTIALKHFQEEVPSIKAFDANMPQSLENIVLKATAKDPADRYQSADQMREDLSTALLPSRLNEPKWEPHSMDDVTKALDPIIVETVEIEETQPLAEEALAAKASEPEPVSEQKPPKKRFKKRWLLLLLILSVFVTAAAAFWLSTSSRKEVAVPNLENMTEAAARTELESVKLKAEKATEEVPSDTIQKGRVVKTDPKSGASIKEGSAVKLYVSSGTKKVRIKNYIGQQFDSAQTDLQKIGFLMKNINVTRQASDDVPEGEIIEQTPSQGTEVDPSSEEIDFVVSDGPEKIEIGDYSGVAYKDAVYMLGQLGIGANQVKKIDESSETVPEGAITRQNPAGGTEVTTKSTISLYVSSGSEYVTLQDIKNYSQKGAQDYLQSVGLKYVEAEEYSDSISKEQVVRTDPGAGASLKKGSTVTIYLSKGPREPDPVPSSETPNQETPAESQPSSNPEPEPSTAPSTEPSSPTASTGGN